MFGPSGIELGEFGLALAVAALTVPQVTHDLVGPSNPKLAGQLGLDR